MDPSPSATAPIFIGAMMEDIADDVDDVGIATAATAAPSCACAIV